MVDPLSNRFSLIPYLTFQLILRWLTLSKAFAMYTICLHRCTCDALCMEDSRAYIAADQFETSQQQFNTKSEMFDYLNSKWRNVIRK